jgi:hypothetical protein
VVALEASDIWNVADFFDPGRQSSTNLHTRCPVKTIPPRRKLNFILKEDFGRKVALINRAQVLRKFSCFEPLLIFT